MTQNVDRETVVSRLLAADDILILCHKNPDGDTIGSGTALCLALQQLGKNAAVLCSDPIPAMYDYMPITVFDGSFTPRVCGGGGCGGHPAVWRAQQHPGLRRACQSVHRPPRLQQRLCL